MTDWSNKPVPCSGKKLRKGHNNLVAEPLKKPDDNGYPKCPYCAPADVPAGAPLLKVYDYGPLGARFFCFKHAQWRHTRSIPRGYGVAT